jgi:phosphate transport system permease protein
MSQEDPTTDPGPAIATWRNPRVIANHRNRRIGNLIVTAVCVGCVLAVLLPLGDMLYMFAYRGLQAISIPRLVNNPIASNPGIGNAIVGTAIITALSAVIAIPLGLFAGIYAAEFSRGGRFAEGLRFAADVLAGVPSIVLGYVCFLALVLFLNFGYSAMAAAIALAIIMFPYIYRTTEIALNRVPESIKEGAIALGSTKTIMVNKLVLRFALPGILTGILLALGISLSETAPLLYTANFANYVPTSLFHSQLGYLTGVIYLFYTSNLPVDVQLAYLASFILIMIVLAVNVVARIGLKRFSKV